VHLRVPLFQKAGALWSKEVAKALGIEACWGRRLRWDRLERDRPRGLDSHRERREEEPRVRERRETPVEHERWRDFGDVGWLDSVGERVQRLCKRVSVGHAEQGVAEVLVDG
jgi:hypothetical protein